LDLGWAKFCCRVNPRADSWQWPVLGDDDDDDDDGDDDDPHAFDGLGRGFGWVDMLGCGGFRWDRRDRWLGRVGRVWIAWLVLGGWEMGRGRRSVRKRRFLIVWGGEFRS
jgi:hypothetical protein